MIGICPFDQCVYFVNLGAHVAGCSAKMLNSTEKIGIIIGLDPASVGFDFAEKDKRLSDTDADYVQVYFYLF